MSIIRVLALLSLLDIASCTLLAQPRQRGAVDGVVANQVQCPAQYACVDFTLTCPEIVPITGKLAVAMPESPRGVVVFHSQAGGEGFYSGGSQATAAWMLGIRDSGATVVQVKWDANWWAQAGGLNSGEVKLACRPATILRYIHDRYYAPLMLWRGRFIATGNSGGSSQIAYALAYYGAASFLDAAVLTAGPPHSALQKSCRNLKSEKWYWFSAQQRADIDTSYGFAPGYGPCTRNDPTFASAFAFDSVAYGGGEFYYPSTTVYQLIGEADVRMLTTAADYAARFLGGAVHYRRSVIADTGHALWDTVNGRAAIGSAIQAHLR